jgi:hypothetical protein
MTNTPNTYADALDVLNARRAGLDMPEQVVLKALELTGDYVPEDRYTERGFVRLFEVAHDGARA